LIDAPGVDYDDDKSGRKIEVTNENAKELLDKINRMKR
jgi:hypothetical protein